MADPNENGELANLGLGANGLHPTCVPAPTSACPPSEELANYACAQVTEARAGVLLEHLAGCDYCATLLHNMLAVAEDLSVPLLPGSGREWRRKMASTFAAQDQRRWRFPAIAAALLIGAGTGLLWYVSHRVNNPFTLLAAAYTATRPFEYRMADAGYASLHQQRGATSIFDRSATLDRAIASIREELAAHPNDTQTYLWKGRAELLQLDYEGAIQSFNRATPGEDGDPDALADLATAYAARGDGERRNLDYGHAVNLYLRALRKRPNDERILFDLAILYEKLWLVDEGIATWEQFLRQKPATGWRKEGEDRLAALRRIKAEKQRADAAITSDPDIFLALRNPDTRAWYDIFWTVWLPQAKQDNAQARAAQIVAKGLAGFGEYAPLETLNSEPSAARQAALQSLARVIDLNRQGLSSEALAVAGEIAPKLEALGLQAAAARTRSEMITSYWKLAMSRECLDMANQVQSSLGPRYPWLITQAGLERVSCLGRLGDLGKARAQAAESLAIAQRAHLWPIEMRAWQGLLATDSYIGNYGPIWDAVPENLHRYWTTSANPFRAQGMQFFLQQTATVLGWNDAAVVFLRAAIRSTHAGGNQRIEISDRSTLAHLLGKMGEHQAEAIEIAERDRLLNKAETTREMVNLRWEAALRRMEGRVAVPDSAADTLAELDLLAAAADGKEPPQLVALDGARGLRFAAIGRPDEAMAAFDRAVARNQTWAASARSWVSRMPMLESASRSYRQLTQLQLTQAHDAGKALAIWNSYHPAAVDVQRSITLAELPAGVVVWLRNGGDVRSRWVKADPKALRRGVEEFASLCASPKSDPAELRSVGNRIYKDLLAPELTLLGSGEVAINAESWLAALPFGALTDDAGEYLSRRYQFAQVYGPNARRAARPINAAAQALVIAAPASVAPGHAPLPALASAGREASEVAAKFSKALLTRDADGEWLSAKAPSTDLFHFSGHGWSNAGNGALILPPSPAGEARFITSRNLSQQAWSRCELAVLSACLTATGETRGSVNNESLVQAMLSAGARRVIAARWSVDSEATRVLMGHLYEQMLAGKSVPEALAAAARATADVSGWAHPYYWSAFDVFGAL